MKLYEEHIWELGHIMFRTIYTNNASDKYSVMSSFDNIDIEYLGKSSDNRFRKVMDIDGKPVAFIEGSMYQESRSRMWISIGVHKEYRQKGYMIKLFNVFLKDLKKEKPQVKTLVSAVDKRNKSSDNFVRKQGFIKVVDPNELKGHKMKSQYNYYTLKV